jgi:hypothetical protein
MMYVSSKDKVSPSLFTNRVSGIGGACGGESNEMGPFSRSGLGFGKPVLETPRQYKVKNMWSSNWVSKLPIVNCVSYAVGRLWSVSQFLAVVEGASNPTLGWHAAVCIHHRYINSV